MRSMVRQRTNLQIVGAGLILMDHGEVFVPESLSSSPKKPQRAEIGVDSSGGLEPLDCSLPAILSLPCRSNFSRLPWRTPRVFDPGQTQASSSALQFSSFDKSVLTQVPVHHSPSSIYTCWMYSSQPRRSTADTTPASKAADFLIHGHLSKDETEEASPLNTIDMNAGPWPQKVAPSTTADFT